MLSQRIKNQHLLWRAAFGPMAENSASLDTISHRELWTRLLNKSKTFEKIEVTENEVGKILANMDMQLFKGEDNFSAAQKKQLRQQSREGLKTLNLSWLDVMINNQGQLREKMSLFWHGHFAVRINNAFAQQELLQFIRTNALGDFKEMLIAVSKAPAMLQFLNNQQNKKKHPNENFAREVMELFTLGVGNYTEQDIKEAARAFTGWGFNIKGAFVFREGQHDDGEKKFLGKSGYFKGEDIIQILLEQPQTAKHITEKIYRFFVNDVVDVSKVNSLSANFFKNGYNIESLLAEIFLSDWFYEEKNVGNRIKSPVELIVGIRRLLPMTISKEIAQIQMQKILGQILFYPPNVAGWPGGKNWIDSSSLMIRLRIPKAIAGNEMMDINEKADDDINMGNETAMFNNRFGDVDISWPVVYRIFEKISREKLGRTIMESVLQHATFSLENIEKYTDKSSRENYIRTMIIQLMCTPEYQLC